MQQKKKTHEKRSDIFNTNYYVKPMVKSNQRPPD
jgi:hypothetical protein